MRHSASAPAFSAARQRAATTSRPTTCTPGCDEEPYYELTDEPEPDHTRGLTKRDLGAPDALHGDGSDRGERGVLGGNTVRYRDAQVRRYPVHLRVQGELVARGGDHLTDRELLRPRTDLDHDAAQRVAEWGVAVQPVHRLLVGGDGALLGHRVEQLAHLIRPGARLADQGHLRLADLHHLGAGRDQRVQRPDQNTARLARGHRHVENGEVT